MLFSSLEFLYLFLPSALLVYFVAPRRFRNGVLLVLSLLFYAFGEPIFLLLMVGTVVVNYAFGLWISQSARYARLLLWCAVAVDVGLLLFFKYYGLAASFLPLPALEIALPIGISFYTFQALSYVIDVYRKTVSAQKSLSDFSAYVSLFPQLIAGPIVRYADVERELCARRHTVLGASEGARRFVVGLAKKVLLANRAGQMWTSLRIANAQDPTAIGSWLAVVCFSFQIYFDFSGYSDMAIGLGKIFGFSFPENFRYPYVARSITDFWRRWHITLSSWFREYVYIPLGGNRCGVFRTYRNLLITWGLTGLWHGASWNFVVWGLYFFCILAIEKAFLGRLLERMPRLLRHAYALLFVLIGWLIFAYDGSASGLAVTDGLAMLGHMFGIGVPLAWNGHITFELVRNLPWLIFMAFGCTAIPTKIYRAFAQRCPNAASVCASLGSGLLLLLCTAYLVDSGYNPFLYFRF